MNQQRALLTMRQIWQRCCVCLFVVCCGVSFASWCWGSSSDLIYATGTDTEEIRIGTGNSHVIELTPSGEILRRITGIGQVIALHQLPDHRLVVADIGHLELVTIDLDTHHKESLVLPANVRHVWFLETGNMLLSILDPAQVVELRPDGTQVRVYEQDIVAPIFATRWQDGTTIVVNQQTADKQLLFFNPDGEMIRAGALTSAGSVVPAPFGVHLLNDGSILANCDRGVSIYNQEFMRQSEWSLGPHCQDLVMNATGDLLVAAGGRRAVHQITQAGDIQWSVETAFPPRCVAFGRNATVFVGFPALNEMNVYPGSVILKQRQLRGNPLQWWGIPLMAIVLALLAVCVCVPWGGAASVQVSSTQVSLACPRPYGRVFVLLLVIVLGMSVGYSVSLIYAESSSALVWGVSTVFGAAMMWGGLGRWWQRKGFEQREAEPLSSAQQGAFCWNKCVRVLLVSGLVSWALASVLMWVGVAPYWGCALWFMAWILLIGASVCVTPSPRSIKHHFVTTVSSVWCWLMIVVAIIFTGSLLWRLETLPTLLHHDHTIYGNELYRMWHDEYAEGPWAWPYGGHFAVPNYLSMLIQVIFGRTMYGLRLPSVFYTLLTLFATAWLGYELRGRWLALLAMVLAGSMPILWFFGRVPYVVIPVPFALLAMAGLIRLARGGGMWCGALAGWATAWALMSYHSIYAGLAGFAVILVGLLTWGRHAWQRVLAGIGVAILVGIVTLTPFLFAFFNDFENQYYSLVGRGTKVSPFYCLSTGAFEPDYELLSQQLQHTIESLFTRRDSGSWGFIPGGAFVPPSAGLFLIGVGYGITSVFGWTPLGWAILPVLLMALGVSGLMFDNTPVWYHQLVALPLLGLVAALGLERVLKALSYVFGRWGVWLGTVVAMSVLSWTVFSSSQQFYGLYAPLTDQGHIDSRGLVAMELAEYSPEWQVLLLSHPSSWLNYEHSHLHYYAPYLDIIEYYDLDLALKAPDEHIPVVYLVDPQRAQFVEILLDRYPQATWRELTVPNGELCVIVVEVETLLSRSADISDQEYTN